LVKMHKSCECEVNLMPGPKPPAPELTKKGERIMSTDELSGVEALVAKVLAFMDYYNDTMAKPFKWTYQGKALAA